jgi:hypothetical protein
VVLLMTVVVVLTTTDCCCCSSFSVIAVVVTIVLEADDLSSETRLSSVPDVLLQNTYRNMKGEKERERDSIMVKVPH